MPPTLGEGFVDIPDARYQQAYLLEPGNLESASDRRVAGGLRLTLPNGKSDGLILLTSQPQIWRAWKTQLESMDEAYRDALIRVIRTELLQLDHELARQSISPTLASHLRKEVHALHGRIAPLMESRRHPPSFRELDHLHGQLERVFRTLQVSPTE